MSTWRCLANKLLPKACWPALGMQGAASSCRNHTGIHHIDAGRIKHVSPDDDMGNLVKGLKFLVNRHLKSSGRRD